MEFHQGLLEIYEKLKSESEKHPKKEVVNETPDFKYAMSKLNKNKYSIMIKIEELKRGIEKEIWRGIRNYDKAKVALYEEEIKKLKQKYREEYGEEYS